MTGGLFGRRRNSTACPCASTNGRCSAAAHEAVPAQNAKVPLLSARSSTDGGSKGESPSPLPWTAKKICGRKQGKGRSFAIPSNLITPLSDGIQSEPSSEAGDRHRPTLSRCQSPPFPLQIGQSTTWVLEGEMDLLSIYAEEGLTLVKQVRVIGPALSQGWPCLFAAGWSLLLQRFTP